MLIISKEHDYYDSMSKYGVNKDVVYNRRKRELSKDTDGALYYTLSAIADSTHSDTKYHNSTSLVKTLYNLSSTFSYKTESRVSLYLTNICIFFCGKVYRGIRADTIETVWHGLYKDEKHSSKTFYTYDEFESFMNVFIHGGKISAQKGQFEIIKGYLRFNETDTSKHFGILSKNKVIVAVYTGSSDYGTLIVDCTLKQYCFYKIYDTYTAHAAIYNYIDGVLGTKANETVTISDKDQIVKKGFDPIYGFRKRKK